MTKINEVGVPNEGGGVLTPVDRGFGIEIKIGSYFTHEARITDEMMRREGLTQEQIEQYVRDVFEEAMKDFFNWKY